MSDSARTSAPEVSSLLSQLSNLQSDRERMASELQKLSTELSTMKESKREEMRKVFDDVVQKWLAASVNDENVRKQFNDGMERVIEKTQDNGVWTVVVEASNLHARQIEELEKLRGECEQLKTVGDSAFKNEASRKRARDEPAAGKGNDFWGDFKLE